MIEPLEARIAPAGIVDVILKNGSLTLKTISGDGDENITITSTGPGIFDIDPDAATTLRVNGTDLAPGALANVSGVTKAISISLGIGNDTVDFSGNVAGKLTVDLGDGNDLLTLRPSSYAGDVTVKAGAGNDTVRTLPSGNLFFFGGKLSVTLGEGDNSLALTTTGIVARDLLVTGGAGMDSLAIDGPNSFAVGGKLAFNSGTGEDSLRVNIGDTLSVGKTLSFISLGGITISQTITAQRGVTVGGKLSFTGAADGTLTQTISASGLGIDLAGGVSFSGKSGGDLTQSITASNDELVVVGATTFKGAAGDNITQTLDGASLQLGAVSISASFPPATVRIPSEDGPERAIFFDVGTQNIISDGLVDTSRSSIKGPVNLTGGHKVTLAVVGEVRGPVTIKTAPTTDVSTVTLGVNSSTHTQRMLGPVKITMGGGTAEEKITLASTTFAGPVTMTGSKEITELLVTDSTFFKPVLFTGGLGEDVVNWESGSQASPRDGRVLGTLKIVGGAGADTVNLGGTTAADTALFLGLVTFDGGTETDTLNVRAFAQLLLTVKEINLP